MFFHYRVELCITHKITGIGFADGLLDFRDLPGLKVNPDKPFAESVPSPLQGEGMQSLTDYLGSM